MNLSYEMYFLAYHSSKIALLCKEKNLLKVEHLSTLTPDVNPLYTLKPLLNGKRFEIVTGLETKDMLLRTLTLKLKSKRKVLSALPFQVESILHQAQDELLLMPTLYPQKGQTDVLLLATPHKVLRQHLDHLSTLEIDPDIVSSVPLALFRFAAHFFPEHPSLFIYHCEEEQHTFVVVKEGRLVASQVHKSQDFERMCAYMQKKYPEIQLILNTGEGNIPSPFNPIACDEPNLALYAIPIGLSLDAAKADRQSAQLRQKGDLSAKQLKARKKGMVGFLAACFSLIIVTLSLGHLHLKKQENGILEALGSPKELRLQHYVKELESSLRSRKKSQLHLPTIPRVHEVLTWLSTHPHLSEECSITRLKYLVVKAPKIGSDIKTYAATLDLELTMPSSKVARAFHEGLMKDSEMVDQRNPINWSGDHGIYRAQFYLKPKNVR